MFGIGIIEMVILAILGLGAIVAIVATMVVASAGGRSREEQTLDHVAVRIARR